MVLSRALDPAPDSVSTPATHSHDFLQVLYVEAGQHLLHVDGEDWALTAGDVFVISPGAVIAARDQHVDEDAGLWTVLFATDALAPATTASPASWRAHPLLSPFAGTGRGGHRLRMPVEDRGTWLAHLAGLRTELHERRVGYADGVRAHLTLLLVHLRRLDLDILVELDREPLLSAVFAFIEAGYHEPISLDDVAVAVAQSSGHLTTVVRRRTGRTVGQWITERRMREARRLLTDTDLTISEIAVRVGFRDPGYFTRRFRAEHHLAPRAWRRAGR